MKTKKLKVLVALSGGVDSSVSAALLVASGKYDVTAAYMVNFDNNKPGSDSCWLPDYRDAVRVAAHLKIPIIKMDFTKEYKEKVLDYMFKEYEAGRTPNPDVLCNVYIKFGEWLRKTKEMGFEYLATGHYAQVQQDLTPALSFKERGRDSFSSKEKGRMRSGYRLLESKDKNKDQTYFLHQLSQEQLKHVLFPVGKYTKDEVRKLAKKFDLPTAERAESMGICFVGEVPMKEFLETKIKSKTGKVVTTTGEVVGEHDGLAFYTIGQRHLGMKVRPVMPSNAKHPLKLEKRDSSVSPQNDTRPLYVVGKNIDKNELVVGADDDAMLFKKEIVIENCHWIDGQKPKFPLKCEVRLRHREPLKKCVVEESVSGIVVRFAVPERAVTPGQFAVFYKKGECLGGGAIA